MPEHQRLEHQINVPDSQAVGVYADFTNLWHTPTSFVLDFLSLKMPPRPHVNPENGLPIPEAPGILESTVSARVRIPPEQVFLLINALQQQADLWLKETGRTTPPDGWDPTGGAENRPPRL